MNRWLIVIVSVGTVAMNVVAVEPRLADKIRVSVIIREVAEISRQTKDLDTFGRNTMKQSQDILELGPNAVVTLSWYLRHPDWKLRFWIVDMLGYVETADAERPLIRVIDDQNEKPVIRARATRSLVRIKKQPRVVAASSGTFTAR